MVEEERGLSGTMGEMRAAFGSRDWRRTVAIYEKERESFRADRGLRVEAGCLAARALIALGRRSAGRLIVRGLATGTYRKATHYEFLAWAFLDLEQYKDAAKACQQAEALRQAEQTIASPELHARGEMDALCSAMPEDAVRIFEELIHLG